MRGTIDGNEAAARVAYALSESIAIYPITPASPMGEAADAWAADGQPNLWGRVPTVVEMQSEAGAAGTLHGVVTAGALGTTFTASQGLLLMLPNMYKIAGELTPTVIHVAARTVATHALSIFGDHSDVMAARQTGFALLASGSVQEAHDLAAIAHAATFPSRIPFLHFFDGFRTSHEIATIELIDDDCLRDLLDHEAIIAHRMRALDPDQPSVRGTAQNPDVFFQAREACNPFYEATPGIVQAAMDRFAELTGRSYRLFDYYGHPEAERVLVVMGSGSGPVIETVEQRAAAGDRVGAVVVRLYRPFDQDAFLATLPGSTKRIAVLDRTKEPGAPGEPLFQDVITALSRRNGSGPLVIGGRYGLSSKEFTPSMVGDIFANLDAESQMHPFTVGIIDDVSHLSLPDSNGGSSEPDDVFRAVFFGLGSDGTVGANKSTVKIIGDASDLHAQGYFVYDSKKSGSVTVSHLRFSPRPIRSTYLVGQAQFVGCHQFDLLEKLDVLEVAAPGATLLINSPHAAGDVWDELPPWVKSRINELGLEVWTIDASRIAAALGLGGRINIVLQSCFFALTDLIEAGHATAGMVSQIRKSYGKRGDIVVDRNIQAMELALAALERVETREAPATNGAPLRDLEEAPDFVQRVTAMMMAGKGDLLPVSALPVDGAFPTATTQWEKRSLATEIPMWDPSICIDCARCALVCPHAAIRVKVYDPAFLESMPDTFAHKEASGKEHAGQLLTVQVAPDDCTGCGICVEICPAISKERRSHKAIDMVPKDPILEAERSNFDYFLELPDLTPADVNLSSVRDVQLLPPLFEFSGACSGCGETPYVKLVSQMFGDHAVIANATGCSSIYGGNLPTTPWAVNKDGRGPAWSNSLFEDNAEFGLGLRLGLDGLRDSAVTFVDWLRPQLGDLADRLVTADQSTAAGIAAQRERIEELRTALESIDVPAARNLTEIADHLAERSVWIIGGDGWAYDIGFGGVDHILASGRNVNMLVLDTEVYSNTGGQASKATPRAAVAKFATGGKRTPKKDLGQIAMSYGNVYVAQIAMGANLTQTVKAFAEAEAFPGTSLIMAYSPCIAHGIDMRGQLDHQKAAVETGYWPLYRYDPARESHGDPGLKLDSRPPSRPFVEFARSEGRFAMLERNRPKEAEELFAQAQQDINDRWHVYEQMVELHRTAEYAEVEG
ncbi:MAG: pyruvate:ferredoxin (flavodoxin) oxidoreductase [Acidimicrobiia bacterium]|nr:pyruvate:ferredoxin (flavodoxin) oxidoreductase [Acidimicrobiia bacterium]